MSVSFSFAKRNGVFIERTDDGRASVVCRPDASATAILEACRVAAIDSDFREVAAGEFDRLLQSVYESADGAENGQAMAGLGDELDLDELAGQLAEPLDLLESADDAPVIRVINAILAEAIRENASDIHIEPFEGPLVVRLRIDGVLRRGTEFPAAAAPLIVSRIKVMAKLDIAEKRIPQDGRISLRVANRPVDVRVSTLPAGHGERVVLRLLDKQAGRLELEQIGMDAGTTARLDRMIHKPHGIFLVTGPTGSGKTTTLYAALSRLNEHSRNIMTVEDPIEYFLDGIAQTQVNTRVDMSFARGLRAMLRQDPDVVMVGEIRDLETAQIAVQASLTGHVVLSTLHTNSAVGAVTRLRDMGTEPYLLASSLVGVLAQRLVRVLCEDCKRAVAIDATTAKFLGAYADEANGRHYTAHGCPACNGIGYRGRTAIYELVDFDAVMRELVHRSAPELELERQAATQAPGLLQSGQRKVASGQTTIEEVTRVTQLS